MNLIIFLIRAFAGMCFLVMAGMSIDPDLPKYNNDWHSNSGATVASVLLATLYFWPLFAEAKSRGVVARMPKAKSFTRRRFVSFGRACLAYLVGIVTVDYFFELQFSCGILSLIAVAWLMPPLDTLLFAPNPEMAFRLNTSSTFLKAFPNLGAFSVYLAISFFAQKNYTGTIDALVVSISLLLVVPIVLLARGGWKALSLKPAFSPPAIPHQQFERSVYRPMNCILCSRKLHFLNTPVFDFGKLKDGGIVCSKCYAKIAHVTTSKLKRYTLSDIKNLLLEKAIAADKKRVDRILQKKLLADKRNEARLLEERAKIAEKEKADKAKADEQKKVNAIIQHIVSGLLQKATANEQKNAHPKRLPDRKNYNAMQMKDIFICHASEDKKTFIEPLLEALSSEDISCWYDNAEIKWGDSIVKKVNQGLRSSRFVLVALSMNSIKKHWPNAELEASINMEFSAGTTKVLPLLIGNDEEIETIIEHYPILQSKLYVKYSIGIKEILKLLKERIVISD
jgi:hypothetical protein